MKHLVLFLLMVDCLLAADISTVLELYLIGTDAGTRGGNYVLLNDIDLDYTDGYIDNTAGVIDGSSGDAVEAWSDKNRPGWVVGDICQNVLTYYYCVQAHNQTDEGTGTPAITNTDYWQPVGLIANGWRGFGTSAAGFTGTFDGQGHTITQMYQKDQNTVAVDSCGLVGTITGGTIKNLTLANVYVTDAGMAWVGGLAAKTLTTAATFTNCHVSGTAIGTNNVVTGAGGITGYGTLSTFTKCSSSVNVSNTGNASRCGSFAGNAHTGTYRQCYATGTASGVSAGGFAGRVNGTTLQDCYYVNTSVGAVNGTTAEGGFIGDVASAAPTITNCYSSTKLEGTATATGSFIGTKSTFDPVITSCFFDDTIDNGAGAVDTEVGKTTAEMKTRATYNGWNFSRVWESNVETNSSYPFLWDRDYYMQRTRSIMSDGNRHRYN